MRNLKKVLSLVLCVAMMLSVMVMSTGAVTITDADDISPQYAEAAEVLTGMGIINGYEDDSFKPQQSITRAEVAAMIYRVATGDVEDEKADINAGAKLFPDVDKDDWYAGYVNYCGDAEYIKGYEDDTFRADNDVTGYEVLAMILRALGYDSNKEFTGPTWTINVVSTATDVGMLKNLDNSVDLAVPASREVVAELIFQAIRPVNENVNANTEMVHWSLAAGDYRPDNAWNPESLGEKVFDLAVKDSADEWGRPEVLWTYTAGDEETVIEIAPVETYKTAVAECDVYEDTGVSGQVNGYLNGQETTYNISKTATKDTIGAQGQLVEVYDYTTVDGDDATRIVAIDTFLAQVTDVTEVKYDSKNHVAKDAALTLTVYDGNNTSVTLTQDTNYTYAVGDMLLVNAYTVDADADAFVDNTADGQYVEIYSVAESFVGAQTTIHYNADTHTINGTEYNDAYKFVRDDAGVSEDYNFNWYLDQYGNVIGATGITSNYAVLKDIIWITGRPGYAEATLVYMDGSEATVTVDSIDGFSFWNEEWDTDEDDTTPVLRDAGIWNFGQVSTDSSRNGAYDGYAMYRVDTNSDGSVNLEGKELYKLPGQTGSYMLEIEYANDVTLDIDASAIVNLGDGVVTHVSNNTQILVNDNGTYTAYTGTANLPDFNRQTVEVFYDDEDDDNVADYVYIKTFSNVHGMYVFATSDAHSIKTDDYGVYLEGVYVDGVETTIVAEPAVAHELIANQGKLYFADWVVADNTSFRYGVLEDIALVNEYTDYDGRIFDETFANYLEDVSDLSYVNGTLVVNDNLSYNVGSTVEVVYNDKPYTMNLSEMVKAIQEAVQNGEEIPYGIWVVGDRFNNTYTVYAGERLEETNTITVTPAEGVADGALIPDADDPDGQNYTYTINDKNDDGKLDLVVKMDATSQYASMVVTETTKGASTTIPRNADGTVTLENVAKGDTYKVTVTTECEGQCAEATRAEWTITIDGWNIISDTVTKVTYEAEQVFYGQPLDVYYSYEAAVDSRTAIDADAFAGMRAYADGNLVVMNDSATYPVKALAFTTTGLAELSTEAAFADAAATTVQDGYSWYAFGDLQSDGVVVLGFTPQGEPGETVYAAFQINRD